MARIATEPHADTAPNISSRRHFATIAWLRWRIFVNSFRTKGATGELVVRFISYPFLALMILGPAVGAAFGTYYIVHGGELFYLAIPLWLIFALWQFIGINTSATGPSFDLSSLIRFPIRYRDYLLIRLSFGLMDPPTLAGIACLIAMVLGILIAEPGLAPWAIVVLVAYALCNILFSRMIYAWLERWLAQRRTRELVTGIILLISLGAQFLGQYVQRLSFHHHGTPINPWLLKASHAVLILNWFLPPGLAASSLDHMHSGSLLIAISAFSGVLFFCTLFLYILHKRLRAQYLGEDLSEAPAARPRSVRIARATSGTTEAPSFSLLPGPIAACLVKEIRYLLRSGPKLYVLIMPAFIVFLISMRSTGIYYTGMPRNGVMHMLFSYGCAYTQLIFVSLIYNAFGSDGAGVQFYFLSPVRMRDVVLAKNLLTIGVFTIEAILVYATAAFLARPTPLDLTAATLAWSAFALFLSMCIGNIRSIVSPKGVDPAKVRSQNVSGMSSLISFLVVAGSVGLGAGVAFLCHYLHTSYWLAAGVFLILAAFSFAAYALVLNQIDTIAIRNIENLVSVLAKT